MGRRTWMRRGLRIRICADSCRNAKHRDPAALPDHSTMLTKKYGPAHLSLSPAPAWSSGESITPPPPRIISPSRQVTGGDGCPPWPNKSTIRSVSPRLSTSKMPLCQTSAWLRGWGPSTEVTRRQPSSSVRIPSSSAMVLVASTKFRGGDSVSGLSVVGLAITVATGVGEATEVGLVADFAGCAVGMVADVAKSMIAGSSETQADAKISGRADSQSRSE